MSADGAVLMDRMDVRDEMDCEFTTSSGVRVALNLDGRIRSGYTIRIKIV